MDYIEEQTVFLYPSMYFNAINLVKVLVCVLPWELDHPAFWELYAFLTAIIVVMYMYHEIEVKINPVLILVYTT